MEKTELYSLLSDDKYSLREMEKRSEEFYFKRTGDGSLFPFTILKPFV